MRRRHRSTITMLCLCALVWCQTAMATGWCHGPDQDKAESSSACHAAALDGDPFENTDCPGSQALPDMGKLPTLLALPAGHDFSTLPTLVGEALPRRHLAPLSRAGPRLDALCRLLI